MSGPFCYVRVPEANSRSSESTTTVDTVIDWGVKSFKGVDIYSFPKVGHPGREPNGVLLFPDSTVVPGKGREEVEVEGDSDSEV